MPRTSAPASPTAWTTRAPPSRCSAPSRCRASAWSQPTLGETVVVIGLGLIGLLAVQLLRANGCRVLGIDFDAGAARAGAAVRRRGAWTSAAGEDPVAAAVAFSRGRGVDAVLITASTKSSEPVHQAAQMCRKRGRIVLVGVTGLELSRADFYEKELSFQVSCSYGPGRYDPSYEEKGHDYPLGFVRWTEQRNFEAVLDMHGRRAAGREAADLATASPSTRPAGLRAARRRAHPRWASCCTTPSARATRPRTLRARTVPLSGCDRRPQAAGGAPVVGVIGAGNYAGAGADPGLQGARAPRCTRWPRAGGVSGVHVGPQARLRSRPPPTPARCSATPDVDAVVIATRHDSHARLCCDALARGQARVRREAAGLTLRRAWTAIEQAYAAEAARAAAVLMVGLQPPLRAAGA